MGALELDTLTWPEVEAELEAGRDTVVIAFGATEQHGRHMPLATDALLGDEFARALAERLNAFVAPTVRVGCSSHHLDFPGTLSLEDETFHAIVADLVRSLARGGFRRVVALTDLSALIRIATVGEQEYGVPLAEGGLHAGEWETSMMLSAYPQLVKMDRAEAG